MKIFFSLVFRAKHIQDSIDDPIDSVAIYLRERSSERSLVMKKNVWRR